MRTSQQIPQNTLKVVHPGACRAIKARARTGFCSKALVFLLAVFMICAFAQAIQLNGLLAEAASVNESIAGLRVEQECLSAGYSSYFNGPETHGAV